LIRRAWTYMSGYVVIKVKGANLERFLNRLARADVPAWDTQRVAPHMLVARVGAGNFRRVRAMCRGQGWKVAIVEKVGLPFVCAAALRRKALLAGAVLFMAALFVASNFIWFVRIEGGAEELEERIMAVVTQGGLRPGTPVDQIDRERLQRSLLLEVNELAWAAVNVKGTLAVVEVAERTVTETGESAAGNLVAAQGGVVEQVRAFRGHAVVKPGDIVRAGDVLISGFIPPESDEHRRLLEENRPPYVRADGVVRARIWYEGKGRAHLVSLRETPTGNRATGYLLRLGNRTWQVGNSGPPFESYVEARSAWEAEPYGGYPVGLERVVYIEVDREREPIDEDEALESAKAAALIDLEARVPEGAEFVDGPHVDVQIIIEEGRPIAQARAWVEVLGELGRFEPIEY